jgi:hypothetical protein
VNKKRFGSLHISPVEDFSAFDGNVNSSFVDSILAVVLIQIHLHLYRQSAFKKNAVYSFSAT